MRVLSEDLIPFIFLLSIGGVGLVSGFFMWTGRLKTWFLVRRIPVLLPTAFFNGSVVLLGLVPITLAVAALTGKLILLWCLVLPLMMLALVLAIWQPWWIQPAWYRWLEEHHGDIIPLLQEEARAMGRWNWQRRVATQEGLERWVAEVRRKHGLD